MKRLRSCTVNGLPPQVLQARGTETKLLRVWERSFVGSMSRDGISSSGSGSKSCGSRSSSCCGINSSSIVIFLLRPAIVSVAAVIKQNSSDLTIYSNWRLNGNEYWTFRQPDSWIGKSFLIKTKWWDQYWHFIMTMLLSDATLHTNRQNLGPSSPLSDSYCR